MSSHKYQVDLTWKGNTGKGTQSYRGYSRAFEVAAEGKPTLEGSSDPAFRGEASRWNPEELFLSSIASCHMLWFLHLAADAGIVVTAYTDSPMATMLETEDGGHFESATLRPEIELLEPTKLPQALDLHHQAHKKCFIANSLNFPVHVRPSQAKSGFSLDQVVPWGRSFDEYCTMFKLTPSDLSGKILGCGDGPASFNAEATAKGHSVVSADPIYAFSAAEIAARIEDTRIKVMEQTRANKQSFVWNTFKTPNELEQFRLSAMDLFVKDFQSKDAGERYVTAELPKLPFEDNAFDMALVSHFLFLYSDKLDYDFHLPSILELLRVAKEVRIFPLIDLSGRLSDHLDPVISKLRENDIDVRTIKVGYEFQKGGNQMLVLTKK